MAELNEWFDLLSGGRGGDVFLPMLSGSMAQALLPGDMLRVRPIKNESLHIGDIVVFRDRGRLVAHRLIMVFKLPPLSFFLEKGDANRMASLLDPRAIVGRVEGAQRNGATVLSRSREAKERGRRISLRGLIGYIMYQAPKNCVKRILGRDA